MIDETGIRIVRALSSGIPLVEEPFGEAAQEAGITIDELLDRLRGWLADGTIRRFGAMLRHQQIGYSVNAMGVWNVADDHAEEFGRLAASSRSVSHCYRRPRFEGFRFNIYTMIHGRSREECEATARDIAKNTGIGDYELLYTTSEFKKSSPRYFVREE